MLEQHVLFANAAPVSDLPSVCQQALMALASPYVSTEEVGAILSRDKAITLRLLQSINSAHFGLARRVTTAAEAVALLGFDRVTSMLHDIESPLSQPEQAAAFLPHITPPPGVGANPNAGAAAAYG